MASRAAGRAPHGRKEANWSHAHFFSIATGDSGGAADMVRQVMQQASDLGDVPTMTATAVSGELGAQGNRRLAAEPAGYGESRSMDQDTLLKLHALLDRPWFCARHDAQFKMGAIGREPALLICRPQDQVIAHWTCRDGVLVFATRRDAMLRAELLECAVSITCEFLDRAKARA
jgi:hypothetical protein